MPRSRPVNPEAEVLAPVPPPLSAPLRRSLVVLGLAGVVALAVLVIRSPGPPAIDSAVWEFFVDRRAGRLTPVVVAWTWIGSTLAMTVWCVTLSAVFWRRRDARAALLVLGVGIGAAVLVFTVKRLVDRPRPPAELRVVAEQTWSFPSGHALAATAVLGVTALLLPRLLRPRAVLPVRLALLVFWAGIGASRLYLAVHWFTDVVAGAVLGACWVLVALDLQATSSRRRTPAPPSPGPPDR